LPIVSELRVRGVMIGLELTIDGSSIVRECLDRGLLINATQQTVIRLLPALTLEDGQVDEGCEILADVLKNHTTKG
jgi:acetylornithine/N-succinyldiaminopimelate aminotransferase